MKNWYGKDAYAFGREFLYYSGQDADKIIFWGRIPMVILSFLLGLVIFFWAKELFGLKASFFSLFLYSFCPNIIAHSQLVTPDIGVCLFTTLSVYCLWRYLTKPNGLRLIFTGITLGLSLLSKFNSLVLLPIFLILIYIYGPRGRFFVLTFIVLLLAFFVIWSGYSFETGKILEEKEMHPTLSQLIKNPSELLQRVIHFIGHRVFPFPSYFKGLGWILHANINKHESFFMGKHFRGSSVLGFLIAFIIKTPIPFLIFIFFSIILAIKNRIFLHKEQLFLWLLPMIIFLINGFFSFSLHLKYILPIYPFLCIFIGQIVNSDFFRLHLFRLFILGLCLWYLLGTLDIYPHYLAYFNEFVGGPKYGYKYLVDSNLDWGQDLKLLKQYLDRNNISEIKLAYFGTADPDYYRINYQRLEPFKPTSGWIAISVTYLQGIHTLNGGYDWLKKYEPEVRIGYSIFLYNLK
ncbi:MAG: glycosyltransferase family 39 protein [Candidatus Omnitrophica bacterium]|nr:glycosyltransferase family 39 protein [Candidatus Omnitrophota bacterium]